MFMILNTCILNINPPSTFYKPSDYPLTIKTNLVKYFENSE